MKGKDENNDEGKLDVEVKGEMDEMESDINCVYCRSKRGVNYLFKVKAP